MERDQPAGPNDALHPVRRLRGALSGRVGAPVRGRIAPAVPSPVGAPGVEPRAGRATRLRLAAGVALALAVSAAWSAAALHGEQPAPPTSIPAQVPTDAIGNLRMFSQTTGWAQRQSDGAVLHTSRGVLRWTVASPPTLQMVIAVSYVDASAARALTVPANAQGPTTVESWATGDGGATWSAEGSFAVVGFSPTLIGTLDFVDPLHGWFSQLQDDPGVTGTALYRMTDGGVEWSQVAFAGTTGPATAPPRRPAPAGCVALTAAFVSTTTGWLSGTCSTGPPPLYVSHDGGRTWADQPLAPIPGRPYGEQSSPPSFTSAEDGTLITEDVGAAPISAGLFTTTDGGRTWSLRYSSAGTPFGSDFVDADHGWLAVSSPDGAAAAPDLYVTGDGGSTWSVLHVLPDIGWSVYIGLQLDFLTPGMGWASTAVTQSGGPSYLLATEDGGHSWSALRPLISTH
jgi:photosystem II stability/assembly factor-like uncharacterized protein